MKDMSDLKTIATYQLGNTSIEIRARGPLTDEAVERFNEHSSLIRLIKKKKEDKDDTEEVRAGNRQDE